MTITGKIDVTKIEKARLFAGKGGAKYLDVVILMRDDPDQYGNRGMIVQSVSKEERAQGVRGPILGNIKVLDGQGSRRPERKAPAQGQGNFDDVPPPPEDDDVPF